MSLKLRAKAREKLSGKWGKSALIVFIYVIFLLILNFFASFINSEGLLSLLISMILFIIQIPLGFGLIFSLFSLYKGEDITIFDFLILGFSNFKKSCALTWQIFLKMFLPIILMLISFAIIISSPFILMFSFFALNYNVLFAVPTVLTVGIILLILSSVWTFVRSYYYQLSYFVSIDNQNLSSKEAVAKSKELMTNNRWNLFKLEFSFIGWTILSIFTFGIGLLWLIPYMQFSIIAFYEKLICKDEDFSSDDNENLN